MKVFFSSDQHFGHLNIIKYTGRPFQNAEGHNDVKVMNKVLIENWNSVVAPEDVVFVLGDFAFGGPGATVAYLNELRGRKILVRGNHDRHSRSWYLQAGFEAVVKSLRIGQISMIHRPTMGFRAPIGTKVVLCGHVHQLWSVRGDCHNVGVDVREFKPVTLAEMGLPEDLYTQEEMETCLKGLSAQIKGDTGNLPDDAG